MAGMFTVAAPIRQAGVVLSQPVVEHHAIDRVAVQHLHQAKIGEVTVQRGSRTLAGFLDRMDGEFQRPAAGRANAVAHAACQFDMMPVAWRQIEPVWAMPMIGLPPRSSSGVMP